MNIINRVNDIILDSCEWQFMMRESEISVPQGASSVDLAENLKIKTIYDGEKVLYYTDEYERHLNGRGFVGEYSIFADKLLIAPAKEPRVLKIIYSTKNHAKDAQGQEKPKLENGTDETLIPSMYAQSVIVYGACLQFKSNSEHPKYKYWLAMFTEARAALRAAGEYIVPKPPKMSLPSWAYGLDRYRGRI